MRFIMALILLMILFNARSSVRPDDAVPVAD
jgi:hypothetical protein